MRAGFPAAWCSWTCMVTTRIAWLMLTQHSLVVYKESSAPYDTEQTLDLIRDLRAGPFLRADPSAGDLGTQMHEAED